MKHHIPFTYIPCQTCNAKIHCDQCAGEVAESLVKLGGISDVVVDMKNKFASMESAMDRDDLEACLEDMGLFPD